MTVTSITVTSMTVTSMTVNIGIICGGRSGEHEVSLQSALGIYHALDRSRFNPLLLAIGPDGIWYAGTAEALIEHPADPARIRLRQNAEAVLLRNDGDEGVVVRQDTNDEVARVSVVFPIVHGTDGEDGALQGMLRILGLPTVGSGVLGSAIGMDKPVMKRLLKDAGLPTARWTVIREPENGAARFAELEQVWGLPLFVKPAALGSSVGISRVAQQAEFAPALEEAFRYDRRVIVEEAIAGREIECSVLGNPVPSRWPPRASVPGEIVPKPGGFYSYAAKYLDPEGAALVAPAELDAETMGRVQELALAVFDTLEAEGMARVDLFLRADGGLVVNEINTLPGFTPISMYPRLWELSGLSYSELLSRLVDLALERYDQVKGLQRWFDLPG